MHHRGSDRRLDWDLTAETLRWIAARGEELRTLYADVVDHDLSRAPRKAVGIARHPKRFLEQAAIRYLAPRDAAHTGLEAGNVDCHYSMTVLEHVAPPALEGILSEARRILKPGGAALHFIDPGDHFAHADRSISAINFLRYSERHWSRLAGNEFAYCNRLRASDFLALAARAGLRPIRTEVEVDAASREALRQGFPLDAAFQRYGVEDLCTTSLRVLWA